MEAILYLIIFMMGTVFGSFFTLAVYRIPIGENITHKHSFCPNCKHKLGFWDMIPILSYLVIGGKCRYCNKQIKIRYLLLEVLSGLVFLTFALSFNINFYAIEVTKLVHFIVGIFYFCGLFIIAGIDKEKIQIQKSVVLYSLMIAIIYTIYRNSIGTINIYYYIIYLVVILLLVILDTFILRKKAKDTYPIEVMMLCFIMAIVTGADIFILTAIFTMLACSITLLIRKLAKKKHSEEKIKKLPIGFYLCTTNIMLTIFISFVANYMR